MEVRSPVPVERRKSLVPEWLMQDWLAEGLEFDPTDKASLLRAVKAASAAAESHCDRQRMANPGIADYGPGGS